MQNTASINGAKLRRLYQGRYEVECSTASLDVPYQSISNCVRMKTAVSRDSSNVSVVLLTFLAIIILSIGARWPVSASASMNELARDRNS